MEKMENIEKFNEEVKKQEKDLKIYEAIVNDTWKVHAEFLEKFPFREHPNLIDNLTPEDLYDPGKPKYFFYYIEHGLKPLGHVFVPSDLPWRNARENIDQFKELLKIAVDESKSLAEKIDAPWENIKRWGGDKHLAKKIIFCYFPEKMIPIFNTDHMEHFIEALNLSDTLDREAFKKYDNSYEELSLGEAYEVLTDILLKAKEKSILKNKDVVIFTRALYEAFPPFESISTPTKFTEPLSAVRMLFSPVDEMGVVALFSMYHRELGFPYFLKIQSGFPDATVVDSKGNVKNIEFELFASNFKEHNHDPDKCDVLVCWEDNLNEDDGLRSKIKIIALKEKLSPKEEV